MKMMNGLAAVVGAIGCVGIAQGEIADFYLADAGGGIYRVDGTTLESSLIVELDNGFSMNDILFLNDGAILANTNGLLVRFDLQTGEERIVFDTRDYFTEPGFYITMGLAAMSNGDVFFTTEAVTGSGIEWFGGTYNPFTSEFTRLADIPHPTGLYFDHHQIGENLFLGADWSGGRISIINSLTGETEFTDVDFDPVSFFESGGDFFALAKGGELYTFDPETGSSTLYGNIQGSSGSRGWIGAASVSNPFILPTPGTLSLLGLMGLGVARRRR